MTVGASVLVGRREELAVLEGALGEVERSNARAFGLRGEPGIGKSRLLAELGGRAREGGLLVLGGRAAELERDLPFALLVDAFEPLVIGELPRAVRELEGEQLGELVAVLPGVGSLAEVEAAPASGERHRVARAVRALLERLAAERPLALLLDDVHWADPASADVLALLLHRPPRGGVLLGLAMRSRRAPALEGALAAARQNGSAELVELGPLPLEVASELMPGVGRAARERLHRESGGNPFYLQELARAGHADADGADRAGMPGVPRAVQAAMVGELVALPATARRVLEGAAVAGDPFEPELAAVAAEVEEEVALASLDELLKADLVRPTSQPRRFRFRHPLVRRAVYEETGGGWRLGAHARAADRLTARG
ncbi:MAG: ATP-binding protein, partial [Thermoleophilaceae bacterium]